MNSSQAKKLPIEDVLERMGIFPVRKDKGGEEWVYNSPFRKETVPSLFVNVRKNVWNDFGERGGTIIDFLVLHQNTGVSGALSFLESLYRKGDFKARTATQINIEAQTPSIGQTFILDNAIPLKSRVLEAYLNKRAINVSIARKYLEVVQFHHSGTLKQYFGLGFKNQSGDYEVRNPKLKAVIGKKDVSLLEGMTKGRGEAVKSVAVFEGFLDFLSYLSDLNKPELESDVIVLNSAKLVERAKSLIRQNDYKKVYTFFDNDKVGNEAGELFSELRTEVIPCNHVYKDFKDYNEYLKHKKQELRR